MKSLMVGDTHGNLKYMHAMIDIAHTNGMDNIIHVGDFGWWPGGWKEFIWYCDRWARQHELPLWVIDGNHDFPGANDTDKNGYRSWQFTALNLYEPGLKWIPRCTLLNIDDLNVAFIGGAVSVDQWEQNQRGTWFPEEALTDEDVEAAEKLGKVDILISHDRRGIPPMFHKYNFKPIVEVALVEQELRWREILKTLQPSMHFHGHFHVKYNSMDEERLGTETIGIGAEDYDGFIGFDFETLEIIDVDPIMNDKRKQSK